MRDALEVVRLVGLDFGSTTSSMMIVEAVIEGSAATGRIGLARPRILYRSAPCFTPFRGESIDQDAIAALIDTGFTVAGITAAEIFAGGAIITGLAARRANAAAVAALVRARIGEMVVATADDPCLKSWLAFMGSCAALSRARPGQAVINLDIGGGTTNPALGRDGTVLATGCYFVGARHFRFEAGGYRLLQTTPFADAILTRLGYEAKLGRDLPEAVRAAVLDYYVTALEAMVTGERAAFSGPAGQVIEQARFDPGLGDAIVTFSGGVGELIYALSAGETLPPTTHFGDFGIDLARAIMASKILSAGLRDHVPEQRGRATVYGLTLHNTELSGRTVFLPDLSVLPLRDLPVVATVDAAADDTTLAAALDLARRHDRGACLQLRFAEDSKPPDLAAIRRLGGALAAALRRSSYPADRALVVIVQNDIGKALGSYATDWGRIPVALIVVDEIPLRSADFVNIGRPSGAVLPIAFFGMR